MLGHINFGCLDNNHLIGDGMRDSFGIVVGCLVYFGCGFVCLWVGNFVEYGVVSNWSGHFVGDYTLKLFVCKWFGVGHIDTYLWRQPELQKIYIKSYNY